jgi:hypothetical protein
MRILHGSAVSFVVLAAVPNLALAQETLSPLQTTVFVGYTPRAPSAFSNDQICPDDRSFVLGARLGFLLNGWIAAEVGTDALVGWAHDTCVNGLVPPPPPQGAYTRTRTFYHDRYTGYPFVETGIRISVIPIARPGTDLRLSAGIARAWSRHLWVPELALGSQAGRGHVRVLFELAILQYSVPLTTLREDFQDGQLVGSQSTNRSVRTISPILRLGIGIGQPAGRQ